MAQGDAVRRTHNLVLIRIESWPVYDLRTTKLFRAHRKAMLAHRSKEKTRLISCPSRLMDKPLTKNDACPLTNRHGFAVHNEHPPAICQIHNVGI